jgi:hypothetical protein
MEKELFKSIEKGVEQVEEKVEHMIKKKSNTVNGLMFSIVIIAMSLMLFNQFQILTVDAKIDEFGSNKPSDVSESQVSLQTGDSVDLSAVDLTQIKSTAHSIAALFPLESVKTAQDAMNTIIPTGIPEYGEELGVSYDDPVNSLNFMNRQLWNEMRGIKTEKPEVWQRYVKLASMPVGISCEYCCGVQAVGIKPDGESACGCQHNPALLALTVWLMDNRPDWSDADVLKEVIKWKALFFPKKMTEMTLELSGMDAVALGELPGMVGGC